MHGLRPLSFAFASSALLLAGCGVNSTSDVSSLAVQASAIRGNVHGGQQPIAGARVYVFEANNQGYGAASTPVLSFAITGHSDSLGAYVLTANDGSFSITGDYTCSQNAEVYLLALGGNPGAGINSAVGEMAALGNCPAAGTFAGNTPFVSINEVSTVAAAYAFAGFATDATHVSSTSTQLARTGIRNAFGNAANLANLGTGAALFTTPAGNGVVPGTRTNTLANILASCVNSSGPGSSLCTSLFANAQNSLSFVVPTETATAAINIAHNPGANVANLFALQTATAPFQPAQTTQPNDFSIAISLSGGGVNQPAGVAIDANGNAWIANLGASVVTAYTPSGAPLSPTGFTGGGLVSPQAVAIDPAGNVWLGNSNYTVSKFTNAGVPLSPAAGYPTGAQGNAGVVSVGIDGVGAVWAVNANLGISKFANDGTLLSPVGGYRAGVANPNFLAIDSNNNVWVTNDNTILTKYGSDGTLLSPPTGFTGGGLADPVSVAIDNSNNVFTANYSGSTVSKYNNSGVPFTPANTGYAGGGLNKPIAISMDGIGTAWLANIIGDTLSAISNTGTALSPATGYTQNSINTPTAIANDASGNVWITNFGNSTVTEFIGSASPVVVPLSVGVQTRKLATRP